MINILTTSIHVSFVCSSLIVHVPGEAAAFFCFLAHFVMAFSWLTPTIQK
jgi:hypothetical protein